MLCENTTTFALIAGVHPSDHITKPQVSLNIFNNINTYVKKNHVKISSFGGLS
jgi:hypothetical protein